VNPAHPLLILVRKHRSFFSIHRVFRSTAENSTSHHPRKLAPAVPSLRFSTNPQHSSQQQVLNSFSKLTALVIVVVCGFRGVKYQQDRKLYQNGIEHPRQSLTNEESLFGLQIGTIGIASTNSQQPHFHSRFVLLTLYTCPKNEYSTLAAFLTGESDDRICNHRS
jgi:hypothetical protein